jgi:hypothetical protein
VEHDALRQQSEQKLQARDTRQKQRRKPQLASFSRSLQSVHCCTRNHKSLTKALLLGVL